MNNTKRNLLLLFFAAVTLFSLQAMDSDDEAGPSTTTLLPHQKKASAKPKIDDLKTFEPKSVKRKHSKKFSLAIAAEINDCPAPADVDMENTSADEKDLVKDAPVDTNFMASSTIPAESTSRRALLSLQQEHTCLQCQSHLAHCFGGSNWSLQCSDCFTKTGKKLCKYYATCRGYAFQLPTGKYSSLCTECHQKRSPARSAGILPYAVVEGKLYFLLGERGPSDWSDFGGVNKKKETFEQTALREFNEETAFHFFSDVTLENVTNSYAFALEFPNKEKYRIYLAPVSYKSPEVLSRKSTDEIEDNREIRSYMWVDADKMLEKLRNYVTNSDLEINENLPRIWNVILNADSCLFPGDAGEIPLQNKQLAFHTFSRIVEQIKATYCL